MGTFEYKVLSFVVPEKPIVAGTKKERVRISPDDYVERVVPNVTGYEKTHSEVRNLTDSMQIALDVLGQQGWRVISVSPVLRGQTEWKSIGGAGFSLTDALVVVLERDVSSSSPSEDRFRGFSRRD